MVSDLGEHSLAARAVITGSGNHQRAPSIARALLLQPAPIVIDLGTGYTKVGFAGQSAPALTSPNFAVVSGRRFAAVTLGQLGERRVLEAFFRTAVYSPLNVACKPQERDAEGDNPRSGMGHAAPEGHPVVLVVSTYSHARAAAESVLSGHEVTIEVPRLELRLE